MHIFLLLLCNCSLLVVGGCDGLNMPWRQKFCSLASFSPDFVAQEEGGERRSLNYLQWVTNNDLKAHFGATKCCFQFTEQIFVCTNVLFSEHLQRQAFMYCTQK